jgi:hypothetical protein
MFLIICCVWIEAEEGWEEISIKLEDSVWASSEYEEFIRGSRVRYVASNVFDKDVRTCWVEASEGDGAGESITFITNRSVTRVGLVNGFARNGTLYGCNNRVKRLGVYLIAAFTAPGLVSELDYYLYFGRTMKAEGSVEVQDTAHMQYFDFPFTSEEQESFLHSSMELFLEENPFLAKKIEEQLGYESTNDLQGRKRSAFLSEVREAYSILCVRFEIEEVYRGSRFNDTCLTELDVVFE